MKLALIQEKQNKLYRFHDDDIFSCDEAIRLQREMVELNIDFLREAAEKGADIALTSEAINYPGQVRCLPGLSSIKLVASTQDWVCAEISRVAREHGMYVVAGILRVGRDGRLRNQAVVFDRSGAEIFEYSKVFLAGDENDYMTPGTDFPIWNSEFGKVGIGICWDMQFPETCRAYARQGVDLVLSPTWGWEHAYACARAYENGVYVAAAMAVPEYKDIEGKRAPSQVIAPDGSVLIEGPYDRPAVITVQLDDLETCRPYRRLRMECLERWESFQRVGDNWGCKR